MATATEQFNGDASEFIGGQYYKREDLTDLDEDLLLAIAGVEKAHFISKKDGTADDRLVLTFTQEGSKRLTLNSTNIKVIVKHYGKATSGWIGKPLGIYFDENVSFGGQLTGGIRVRVPKAKPRPRPMPVPEDTFMAEAEAPYDVAPDQA